MVRVKDRAGADTFRRRVDARAGAGSMRRQQVDEAVFPTNDESRAVIGRRVIATPAPVMVG